MQEAVVAVVTVAPLLTLVVVLIKCLGCLRKSKGFKNFENEESRMEARINPGFQMGQDVEERDQSIISTTIQIEPIADVLAETTPRKPKIACVEKSKQESALKIAVMNNTHQFPRRQLKYLNEIGTGWFGHVLESDAEHITTGIPLSRVVAKVLNDDSPNSEKKLFLEDVIPYRELEHSNVLRLLGQCTESTPYLIILEYAAMGDLKGFMKEQKGQSSFKAKKYQQVKFCIDAASGLACLHRHGYVHNDFAARNCLVMANYTVKVGDYGIAEDAYKADYYTNDLEVMPIRWMSPESLSQQSGTWQTLFITREANIWSFGVLIWEVLMFGSQPYPFMSDAEVLQSVIGDRLAKLAEPDTEIDYKDRLYEVMQFCWLNPGQRPSIEEVHGLLSKLSSVVDGDQVRDDNFDRKWTQTIPSEARVVSARPPPSRFKTDSFDTDFSPAPKSTSSELTSVKVENVLSTSIVNMASVSDDTIGPVVIPPNLAKPQLDALMTSTPVGNQADARPVEKQKSNNSGSRTSRKIEDEFETVSIAVTENSSKDGSSSSSVFKEEKPNSTSSVLTQEVSVEKEPAIGQKNSNNIGNIMETSGPFDVILDRNDEMFTPIKSDTESHSVQNKAASNGMPETSDVISKDTGLDLFSKDTSIDILDNELQTKDAKAGVLVQNQANGTSVIASSSTEPPPDSTTKCDSPPTPVDVPDADGNVGKQTSLLPKGDSNVNDFMSNDKVQIDTKLSALDANTDVAQTTFPAMESLEIETRSKNEEPVSDSGKATQSDNIDNGLSGYETHSLDQSKSESQDDSTTSGAESSSDSAVCVSSPELADAPSGFGAPSEQVGTRVDYASEDESKSCTSDSSDENSGRSYECDRRSFEDAGRLYGHDGRSYECDTRRQPCIQVTDLDASSDEDDDRYVNNTYDVDEERDRTYSVEDIPDHSMYSLDVRPEYSDENTDSDDDMDLRVASELYLSRGVSSPRVYDRPPLETIPEDIMPSPSDSSSLDLRYDSHSDDFTSQDNFEWDDFMGESIVGRDRTANSSKKSFNMSDWELEGDSSVQSHGGNVSSDVFGTSDSSLHFSSEKTSSPASNELSVSQDGATNDGADATNENPAFDSMGSILTSVQSDSEHLESGQGLNKEVVKKDLSSELEKLSSPHGVDLFGADEEAVSDQYNEFSFESPSKPSDIDLFDDFPSPDKSAKVDEDVSVAAFFGVDIPVSSSDVKITEKDVKNKDELITGVVNVNELNTKVLDASVDKEDSNLITDSVDSEVGDSKTLDQVQIVPESLEASEAMVSQADLQIKEDPSSVHSSNLLFESEKPKGSLTLDSDEAPAVELLGLNHDSQTEDTILQPDQNLFEFSSQEAPLTSLESFITTDASEVPEPTHRSEDAENHLHSKQIDSIAVEGNLFVSDHQETNSLTDTQQKPITAADTEDILEDESEKSTNDADSESPLEPMKTTNLETMDVLEDVSFKIDSEKERIKSTDVEIMHDESSSSTEADTQWEPIKSSDTKTEDFPDSQFGDTVCDFEAEPKWEPVSTAETIETNDTETKFQMEEVTDQETYNTAVDSKDEVLTTQSEARLDDSTNHITNEHQWESEGTTDRADAKPEQEPNQSLDVEDILKEPKPEEPEDEPLWEPIKSTDIETENSLLDPKPEDSTNFSTDESLWEPIKSTDTESANTLIEPKPEESTNISTDEPLWEPIKSTDTETENSLIEPKPEESTNLSTDESLWEPIKSTDTETENSLLDPKPEESTNISTDEPLWEPIKSADIETENSLIEAKPEESTNRLTDEPLWEPIKSTTTDSEETLKSPDTEESSNIFEGQSQWEPINTDDTKTVNISGESTDEPLWGPIKSTDTETENSLIEPKSEESTNLSTDESLWEPIKSTDTETENSHLDPKPEESTNISTDEPLWEPIKSADIETENSLIEAKPEESTNRSTDEPLWEPIKSTTTDSKETLKSPDTEESSNIFEGQSQWEPINTDDTKTVNISGESTDEPLWGPIKSTDTETENSLIEPKSEESTNLSTDESLWEPIKSTDTETENSHLDPKPEESTNISTDEPIWEPIKSADIETENSLIDANPEESTNRSTDEPLWEPIKSTTTDSEETLKSPDTEESSNIFEGQYQWEPINTDDTKTVNISGESTDQSEVEVQVKPITTADTESECIFQDKQLHDSISEPVDDSSFGPISTVGAGITDTILGTEPSTQTDTGQDPPELSDIFASQTPETSFQSYDSSQLVTDTSTSEALLDDFVDISKEESTMKPDRQDSVLDDFVSVGAADNNLTQLSDITLDVTEDKLDTDTKNQSISSLSPNDFQILGSNDINKSASNESFSDVSDVSRENANLSQSVIDFPDSSFTDSQESATFLDLSTDNNSTQQTTQELTEQLNTSEKTSIDKEIPEGSPTSEGDINAVGGQITPTSQFENNSDVDSLAAFENAPIPSEAFSKGSSIQDDVSVTVSTIEGQPESEGLLAIGPATDQPSIELGTVQAMENTGNEQALQSDNLFNLSDSQPHEDIIAPLDVNVQEVPSEGLLDFDQGPADRHTEQQAGQLNPQDSPQIEIEESTPSELLASEGLLDFRGAPMDKDFVKDTHGLLDFDQDSPQTQGKVETAVDSLMVSTSDFGGSSAIEQKEETSQSEDLIANPSTQEIISESKFEGLLGMNSTVEDSEEKPRTESQSEDIFDLTEASSLDNARMMSTQSQSDGLLDFSPTTGGSDDRTRTESQTDGLLDFSQTTGISDNKPRTESQTDGLLDFSPTTGISDDRPRTESHSDGLLDFSPTTGESDDRPRTETQTDGLLDFSPNTGGSDDRSRTETQTDGLLDFSPNTGGSDDRPRTESQTDGLLDFSPTTGISDDRPRTESQSDGLLNFTLGSSSTDSQSGGLLDFGSNQSNLNPPSVNPPAQTKPDIFGLLDTGSTTPQSEDVLDFKPLSIHERKNKERTQSQTEGLLDFNPDSTSTLSDTTISSNSTTPSVNPPVQTEADMFGLLDLASSTPSQSQGTDDKERTPTEGLLDFNPDSTSTLLDTMSTTSGAATDQSDVDMFGGLLDLTAAPVESQPADDKTKETQQAALFDMFNSPQTGPDAHAPKPDPPSSDSLLDLM